MGGNGTIIDSTFTNNNASNNGGGVYWVDIGSMIGCTFNSEWINSNGKFNGVYTRSNLTINGGEGILDLIAEGSLSGISIVVLNNETYYYPPNSNINFIYSLENHKT